MQKKCAVLLIAFTLLGCNAQPGPSEIAEEFVKAAWLEGDREKAISLLVPEDAKLVQESDLLSKRYSGRMVDNLVLTELKNRLGSYATLTTLSAETESETSVVRINVSSVDLFQLMDDQPGTSFVEYISLKNLNEKKNVEFKILETIKTSSPPLAEDVIVVNLRTVAGDWRVVEGFRDWIAQQDSKEKEMEDYYELIVLQGSTIRPELVFDDYVGEMPIKNAGNRTLSSIYFVGYYLSESGERLAEVSSPLISVGKLKPGYESEVRVFAPKNETPHSWGGEIELELDYFEFSDSPGN